MKQTGLLGASLSPVKDCFKLIDGDIRLHYWPSSSA